MARETIQLPDGSTTEIEGDSIVEFNGSVFVFPDDATASEILVGAADYDKYEGASIA